VRKNHTTAAAIPIVARLPPLTAVRGFEAAARNLSMTRAAAELNVTHSAVTRQVKALEGYLGRPLFKKHGRGVALTLFGERYFRLCHRALFMIAEETRREMEVGRRDIVRVSTAPSFASHWLVPKLVEFYARHPRVIVQVSTSPDFVDLNIREVDVAIRHGVTDGRGLIFKRLFHDELVLVGRADIFGASDRRIAVSQLTRFCHYFDQWDHGIDLWYRAAGYPGLLDVIRCLPCTDANLLIDIVNTGHGLGLVRRSLVAEELRSGRLVQPHAVSVPGRYPTSTVWHKDYPPRDAADKFVTWLTERALRHDLGPTDSRVNV
jgi:LysR family glycine cleavage system transcriptional activator